MHINRLSNGEKISGGSAILLFVFMFFRWYGVGIAERPNLLGDLRLFEDGGNAWQTLEMTPIFLALVVAVTVGAAVRRLIGQDWEPGVSLGAVICLVGALAACLIMIRIVFPPDLGGKIDGFTFEATLEIGIFLALAAACGIAYGGRRAMREEGVSFAALSPLRHRDKGQLGTRGGR
jgi:energy-converting hydrogenase Eha subunit A